MRSRPGAARLLLVALAAPLAAAPAVAQPWTEPDPAAVVGQWRGPVRWQRCAIDGAPRVALAVGRDGSGSGSRAVRLFDHDADFIVVFSVDTHQRRVFTAGKGVDRFLPKVQAVLGS
mgnify:CR=1 FL=1